MAHFWGVSPSEFWSMGPREWFWLYDVRRPDREHVRLRYDPALLAMIGEALPDRDGT